MTYRGGETAEMSIPGYETVALEFSPGEARGPMFRLAADSSHKVSGTGANQKVAVKIADFISDRRELLLIGRPTLPNLLINGQLVKPTRQRSAAINQYPGYARHGMLSTEAKPWQMAGYDLKAYGANFEIQIVPGESATTAEAWLLTERPFGADDKPTVTPLTLPGAMRHTTQLLAPQAYAAVVIPPSDLSPEAIKGAKSAKLTLEVFGSKVPTCTWSAQANLAAATNFQDMWWAAPAGVESGWGLNLAHQGDTIFATWFTYGADGNPLWLVFAAPKAATNVYAGDVYTGTGPAFGTLPFDASQVTKSRVGTATLTFGDGNHATFAYAVNGIVGTKAITREIFGSAGGTVCE